jgi:predicted DNA binding CopG/RHH family protein
MPTTKRAKRKIPKHWSDAKNEKEEARWWDANSERFVKEAVQKGTLKMTTLAKIIAEAKGQVEKTRLLSLRLPESLIDRAKEKAGAEGVPYQTLMRSILHRELFKPDRRSSS